ncbi:MAG: RNA polymerase sigma factor [Bacteroidota bacterium]
MQEAEYIALIKANHARLVRICRFYEREQDAQEDLYQEMLFQIWRSRHRYRGEAKADTWLYRIAVNTALTHVRSASNRARHVGQGASGMDPAFQPQIEDNLDHQTRQIALYKAIDGLSQVERTLILLYLEERSYQEMAGIMGLSESNVGVRLNRIKKKLAQRIKGKVS